MTSIFPDLDGLAIFVAIMRLGSLTKASKELGLPKATVSRRLAELERTMGTRLLARTTRRWSLTDPGRELFARVEPLVASLSEAAIALRESATTPSGLVRMTAPAGFGQSEIAPVLNLFLAHYPKVRVELLLRDDLIDLLKEGVDIAVRTGDIADSSLISRRLAVTPFWLVASPGYLHAHGTPKTPADLERHVAIVRSSRDDTFELEGAEGSISVRMQWRLAVSGTAPQLEAALAGAGIASLPARSVADAVAAGRLRRLEVGAEPMSRKMTMLFPRGQVLTSAVRQLADFLVAEFGH